MSQSAIIAAVGALVCAVLTLYSQGGQSFALTSQQWPPLQPSACRPPCDHDEAAPQRPCQPEALLDESALAGEAAPAPLSSPSPSASVSPSSSARAALAGAAFLAAAAGRRASRGSIARAVFGKVSEEQGPKVLLASAAIGLSTGLSVLVFEKVIGVFETLRVELPMPILGPFLGAAVVCLVYTLVGKNGLAGTDTKSLKGYLAPGGPSPPDNWPLRAIGNALLAAVTLGSGCSLGPEAPAAVLGANAAFAISNLLTLFGDRNPLREVDEANEEAAEEGVAPGLADREFIDQALQGSKVVAKMEKNEIDKLMKSFRKVVIKPGDVLMRQGDEVGDTDPGLYVTQSGNLDVFVNVDDEEETDSTFGKKVANYAGGGKLIGELAVIYTAPRAATVVATSECLLWSVDRKSFRAAGGRSQGAMRSLSMNPDSVVASGAAAGVAAGFNAPIAGIFFASEVVRPTGENSLDLTTRLLAAALSAAVVTGGGAGPGALIQSEFAWRGGNPELLAFMVLGVTVGVVSYAFKRSAGAARQFVGALKDQGVSENLMPFVGALATVIISFWTASRVQFDGFGALNEVLREASMPLPPGGILTELSIQPLWESRSDGMAFTAVALLGLLASKIVATVVCQASGLVGGAFAPSLFMGACVGAALGRGFAEALAGVAVISNCATYVVVGAASMLAANCSVPITSVVLAVELAGGSSYEATLPLILGIGLALYVSSVLLPALFEGLSREQALQQLEESAENQI